MTDTTQAFSDATGRLLEPMKKAQQRMNDLNAKALERIQGITPERFQGLVSRLTPAQGYSFNFSQGFAPVKPLIEQQVKLVKAVRQGVVVGAAKLTDD